jgi:DNA mismatch repair ATPase MutS
MAGLPDAVIERAQEIADALSGEADIETRVPMRKKMPKRPPPDRQLSLIPSN